MMTAIYYISLLYFRYFNIQFNAFGLENDPNVAYVIHKIDLEI